ncbi:hypothetical protein TNCV_3194361 [Trichonephila clavipes]|uniref:Uncharacterized protein n=1 Tax=Trichonephila clavipes TaxID=2585209 RepID=A0A8X6V0T9_TRICX|nr:hypothetical protein TNCV_3194361 [Trichonephila clavipes]
MREKGDNHLVPDPDCMVDAFNFPKQAPTVSGESRRVWPCVVMMQHNTSSVGQFCVWPSEATHNKLFLSSSTKYTVEPSWPLVLVWPPFELLHRALTTIVFIQYCRM